MKSTLYLQKEIDKCQLALQLPDEEVEYSRQILGDDVEKQKAYLTKLKSVIDIQKHYSTIHSQLNNSYVYIKEVLTQRSGSKSQLLESLLKIKSFTHELLNLIFKLREETIYPSDFQLMIPEQPYLPLLLTINKINYDDFMRIVNYFKIDIQFQFDKNFEQIKKSNLFTAHLMMSSNINYFSLFWDFINLKYYEKTKRQFSGYIWGNSQTFDIQQCLDEEQALHISLSAIILQNKLNQIKIIKLPIFNYENVVQIINFNVQSDKQANKEVLFVTSNYQIENFIFDKNQKSKTNTNEKQQQKSSSKHTTKDSQQLQSFSNYSQQQEMQESLEQEILQFEQQQLESDNIQMTIERFQQLLQISSLEITYYKHSSQIQPSVDKRNQFNLKYLNRLKQVHVQKNKNKYLTNNMYTLEQKLNIYVKDRKGKKSEFLSLICHYQDNLVRIFENLQQFHITIGYYSTFEYQTLKIFSKYIEHINLEIFSLAITVFNMEEINLQYFQQQILVDQNKATFIFNIVSSDQQFSQITNTFWFLINNYYSEVKNKNKYKNGRHFPECYQMYIKEKQEIEKITNMINKCKLKKIFICKIPINEECNIDCFQLKQGMYKLNAQDEQYNESLSIVHNEVCSDMLSDQEPSMIKQ